MQRDLAHVDLWEESLSRSRKRRELAAARGSGLPARELSLTVLIALAGLPVTGAAAAAVTGSPASAIRTVRDSSRAGSPDPRAAASSLRLRERLSDSSHRSTCARSLCNLGTFRLFGRGAYEVS